MEILKIYLEEQLLKKYYVIKHLILLKIQSMMGISLDLLQWFTKFLIKSLLVHAPIRLLVLLLTQGLDLILKTIN